MDGFIFNVPVNDFAKFIRVIIAKPNDFLCDEKNTTRATTKRLKRTKIIRSEQIKAISRRFTRWTDDQMKCTTKTSWGRKRNPTKSNGDANYHLFKSFPLTNLSFSVFCIILNPRFILLVSNVYPSAIWYACVSKKELVLMNDL